MTSSPLHLDRIPVLAETDILVVGAGSAGCAAALSLETNTTALTLDVPTLQHCLRQHGALLETPKTKAHTGPQDWKQNRT